MQRVTSTLPSMARPVHTQVGNPGWFSWIGNGVINTVKGTGSFMFRHPILTGTTLLVSALAVGYFRIGGAQGWATAKKTPVETSETMKKALDKAQADLTKAQSRLLELTNNTNGLIRATEAKAENIPDQRKVLEENIAKNKKVVEDLESQISAKPEIATSVAGPLAKAKTEIETDEKSLKALDAKALTAEARKLKREALDLEETIEKLNDSIVMLTKKHKEAVAAETKKP